MDPVDPISIVYVLHDFKMVCDSDGNHEDCAMFLFLNSMSKPKAATSTACI